MARRAAVLWLHGLGDSGPGWEGAFGALPGVQFVHPTAPTQPVSIQGGGACTSWFDLTTWPISAAEPEPPEGIKDSVATVHRLIEQIEADGVPPERVVLGGFSQGGTLALLAGLSCPKRLAGVVSISGWCAYRAELAGQIHPANKELPVLFCCGTRDPVVSFGLGKLSGELLQAALEGVTVKHAERGMHQPDGSEMEAAVGFMVQHAQCLADQAP